MDTLIFIEELGRNGEVLRRHRLDRLPVRVGRGYDADVVLDDLFVAPDHIEVRRTEAGGLEAVDLGSKNGIRVAGSKHPVTSTPLLGDEVLRIGRTQLRVRLPGHAVPAEHPLRRERRWDRNPAVFSAAVLAFIGFFVCVGFVETHGTDSSDILTLPMGMTVVCLVWAGIWALVCRTIYGFGNFLAHGLVALTGMLGMWLVEPAFQHVQFGFGVRWPDWIPSVLTGSVLAGMLYRHLRLTMRTSSRTVGTLAVVVVGILVMVFTAIDRAKDADQPGLQHFNPTIEPAVFLLSRGTPPDQFFIKTAGLKTQVDAFARSAQR